MPASAKARLQPVDTDQNETPLGPAIEVQFNPTTLRVALATQADVGATVGRQTPQYLGTSSATLSVELVFDTADEGTTDAPRSVLDKTTPIQQLLLPQGDKQSPPKVRFEWGPFTLTGVVESINLELEFFSEDGVPLRAKVGLSIREQRSDLEFMSAGPGANSPGNAVSPIAAGAGALGIGLGASFGASVGLGLGFGVGISAGVNFSAGASVQTALAIEGESAASFAARVGVDPAAWRAVAAGQSGSSLSFSAGTAVDFSPGTTAGAGLGARAGAQAGVDTPLESAFGLTSPPSGPAVSNLSAPGFALAEAGGLHAAADAVSRIQSQAAGDITRRAFAASSGSSPAPSPAAERPGAPEQSRIPLRSTGLPSATERRSAQPAPSLPRPDPRATTFGSGVPLRARAALPATGTASTSGLLAAGTRSRAACQCGCANSLPCGCQRAGGVR